MKLLIILAGFAALMLFLTTLAVFLERYWRQYLAERAAKSETSSTAKPSRLLEGVSQWLGQLRSAGQPAQSAQSEALTNAFRAWIIRDLAKEQALQSWLLALPESGLALLAKHVASFCEELNLDLQWLLDQQVAVDPELQSAMRAIIINYCRACQKAIPVQKQARLFAVYQQLLQTSPTKEGQTLGRTLYASLVAQGLTPGVDLSSLSEQERQQQVRQAIQQSAAKDWGHFAKVLQAILTPNDATTAVQPGPGTSNGPPQNGSAAKRSQPAAQQAG